MGRQRDRRRGVSPQVVAAPPARSWTGWLLPDLSLTASLAAVAYCLFVFNAPSTMFNDSDTGWHILVGEQILRTREVPRTETFSFLTTGHGWYAWEWAAEIVMGAFHQWHGLSGVVFLFAMTIGAAVWMCFRLHRRLGGDFFLACLMSAPLVTTAQIHWLARPHVLSYLFLLGLVLYFERAGDRFRVRDGLILGLGTALWAGVHGSFPLAIALALLYGAGHAARAVLWKDLDAALEWRKARWFLLAALCAGAGSLLNPYGLELHRHVAGFSTAAEITSKIEEWMPLDLRRPDANLIMMVAAVGGLGALLALWQRNVPHFLAAGFLVALALRSARGLPMVALVALPMANAAITRALEAAKGRSGTLAWLMNLSVEMRNLDRGHHGAAIAPLAALAVLAWLLQPAVAARTGFPHDRYPVEADAMVAALPASARIFTSSAVGGYYIYRFQGQRKIWIDGRADYYGVEPLRQFDQIVYSQPGWEATADRVGFTHAVVGNGWPVAAAMAKAGWQPLYRNSRFTLFERPPAGR
jgi:hypothetical protein